MAPPHTACAHCAPTLLSRSISIFDVWQLFVIYYQADVTALATIGIVMGLMDAVNGPVVAKLADAGWMNQLRWFPKATWGRRAPLLLLSIPISLIGPTLMWLVPTVRDRNLLTAWYAMCYFLVVNSATIAVQSYLSSIQELFPTGSERATAIVRQTPFLALTYVLAGAMPFAIAFTENPDTAGACCVTQRFDCKFVPPCGCFASLDALTATNDTPISEFYHPRFLAVCTNGSSLQELVRPGESAEAAAVRLRHVTQDEGYYEQKVQEMMERAMSELPMQAG